MVRKVNNMHSFNCGDIVKIEIYVTEKWSRIATCEITNKYIRNGITYYSVREVNGSYIGSNIKENKFLTD